jgi:hypothetical protein
LVESFVVEHVVLDVPRVGVPLLAQIVVGVHLGEVADPYLLVEVEIVEDVLGIVLEVLLGDHLDDLEIKLVFLVSSHCYFTRLNPIRQACRPWGCQLNLSQPRGSYYAHQLILAPPDFQTFRRPCKKGFFSNFAFQHC